MNDAIAALSTQKLQALGGAAHCPHDDAETQTGPPGSAPRETYISHKVLEEDPREGRAAAELHAGDGTQAGASAGAQEEGAAQGDSVERAGQSLEQMERVLSVQGRGAGGEQRVLKEAESPQEALGESTEMGEQAQVGVEGEGGVQGRMKWEKLQLPGGENLEAVLKAREVELSMGCFATDVLWVPGEHLEPEVPGWVEVQMAAVQGVTEAPNPEKVDGEGSGAMGHSWGEMEGTELQPPSVAADLGTEQAESVGPDVQLLEEADRAEPDLEEGAGAAAVLGEGLSPAEIPAGSPAPDGLVPVSAQELEGKEAEPLVALEELTLPYGESTGAAGKPLCSLGLWEGAESPAVALEAAPCMADSTDMWNRDVEPALHPEYAAAAEHAHPDAGLVSSPDKQILEETQGVSADAEEKPLDGARGLEVVQGARLEAEAKILVEAQHLELKQGRDASAATLAPPVSEVPLQISTLDLDAMMQEDVLIPDVQRLGGSGQAAQRQLQQQVSAQADKGRLHAAPRQPQKPPGVTEAEQAAAGPAETPKQEVPPASALHTGIQQGEDAAKYLSGVALGDSPLVEAVSSRAQLSGEQREELDVEKKREMEQKMSPGGEPSPGEPDAVTVNGAAAAPKGPLEPDHLYNVLFVGDSHVGKTSFLYRLHADTFNPHLAATVGLDYRVKNLVVDNKRFALRLWDSAGQERYHSVTKQFFRKADGVVLMYDVTSQYSFADVRYWLSCIQEGAEDGVTVLLLGNKTDCAAERQVPTKEGERLAQEHQLLFYECSAASGHNVTESIVSLVRALKVCEDRLRNKAEEEPKLPQKKKRCCW
uniref:Ras-related protein Rab-44 n=1 Tax=Pavo cristatus TaxID=9049 RepID=A0A8C9EN07_PAVCR